MEFNFFQIFFDILITKLRFANTNLYTTPLQEYDHKRKNLEFQMLAAVYHKGEHGQYCYILK